MSDAVYGLLYLLAVNIWTFAAFGLDKRQARRDAQRFSERNLLTLALVGGSLGAKVAQKQFRHKTRKQPFAMHLNLIICLQVLAIVGGLVWLAVGAPAI